MTFSCARPHFKPVCEYEFAHKLTEDVARIPAGSKLSVVSTRAIPVS